jgi:hypothetical protein
MSADDQLCSTSLSLPEVFVSAQDVIGLSYENLLHLGVEVGFWLFD